jgi:allantoicase
LNKKKKKKKPEIEHIQNGTQRTRRRDQCADLMIIKLKKKTTIIIIINNIYIFKNNAIRNYLDEIERQLQFAAGTHDRVVQVEAHNKHADDTDRNDQPIHSIFAR